MEPDELTELRDYLPDAAVSAVTRHLTEAERDEAAKADKLQADYRLESRAACDFIASFGFEQGEAQGRVDGSADIVVKADDLLFHVSRIEAETEADPETGAGAEVKIKLSGRLLVWYRGTWAPHGPLFADAATLGRHIAEAHKGKRLLTFSQVDALHKAQSDRYHDAQVAA